MRAKPLAKFKAGGAATHWISIFQRYARNSNWSITISSSPKTGIRVMVAHDAPATIRDRASTIPAGSRQMIYDERGK